MFSSKTLFQMGWLAIGTGFLVMASYFQIMGLRWGTPSQRQSILVFGSMDSLSRHVKELIESRDHLFNTEKQALQGQGTVDPRIAINKSLEQTIPDWQPIPRPLLIGFLRSYLIGVPSDEQQTLSSLANIRPRQHQWDPNNYVYGNFYIYSLGAFLLLSKSIGLISSGLSLESLLVHPDTVSRLYELARLFSGLFNGLTALFLFLLVRRGTSIGFGLMASILYLSTPLTMFMSHMAKPHAMATFFILAGLWVITGSRTRILGIPSWALTSTGFGLASACLLPHLLTLVAIPVIYTLYPSNTTRFWKPVLLLMGVAIIFNIFFYLNPEYTLRKLQFHHLSYKLGFIQIDQSIQFLKDFFSYGHPALFWPFTILGLVRTWYLRERRDILLFLITSLYLITNTLFLRHHGAALPLCAFLIYFTAMGGHCMWQYVRNNPTGKMLLGVIMLCGLVGQQQHLWQSRDLFVHHGNFVRMGEWIRDHVPPGSDIGILDGHIGPARVPPFPMLDYHLIKVPMESSRWEQSRMPSYLIYAGSQEQENTLTLLQRWGERIHQEGRFLEASRGTRSMFLSHEDIPMSVWTFSSEGT